MAPLQRRFASIKKLTFIVVCQELWETYISFLT